MCSCKYEQKRAIVVQFSVKRRTRECSFDEKKNIIVLKLYVLCSAAGFEKKNICQVFSKWNAHCTYLLRFEVQKVKLLNSLFNKLCIYLFYTLNIPRYNNGEFCLAFSQLLSNFDMPLLSLKNSKVV